MAKVDQSKPISFVLESKLIQSNIPGCNGIQKRYVDAVSNVASLMGESVVNGDQESIRWLFSAFDELKRLAAEFWADEHGEEINIPQ